MSRRMIGRAIATHGAALLLAAASAAAQTPASQATRDYVAATAQSDAFERLEATTALAESKTPAVRAFATRMLADHAASSQRLRDTLAQAGLAAPPPGIGGDQSALLAALQSARGAAFDAAYARHQALAHRAALAVQQDYAAGGDVPALRQSAASTAAMVRSHITGADRLATTAANR